MYHSTRASTERVSSSKANAVVLSVTQQPPFDPTTDPTRKLMNALFRDCSSNAITELWTPVGVSFVSIFIVSYHMVFWVCGVARSLSWDYLPSVPQGEAAERKIPWREKPIGSLVYRYIFRLSNLASTPSVESNTKWVQSAEKMEENQEYSRDGLRLDNPALAENILEIQEAPRSPSRNSHTTQVQRKHPQNPSPLFIEPNLTMTSFPDMNLPRTKSVSPSSVLRSIVNPILRVFNPITISLFVSLPIALVPDLKSLFVDTSGNGNPKWRGPDNRPPLAFILDTGTSRKIS